MNDKSSTLKSGYYWCLEREMTLPFVGVIRPSKDEDCFVVASLKNVMPKDEYELHEVIIGPKLDNPFHVIPLNQSQSEKLHFVLRSGKVEELSIAEVEAALELFNSVKNFRGIIYSQQSELINSVSKVKVMSS